MDIDKVTRPEDRGTTDDPAWQDDDLTGGNDSGTSRTEPDDIDKADGPDRTARILQSDGGSAAGAPGPDPSLTPPRTNG
jgi:hypothetical protein